MGPVRDRGGLRRRRRPFGSGRSADTRAAAFFEHRPGRRALGEHTDNITQVVIYLNPAPPGSRRQARQHGTGGTRRKAQRQRRLLFVARGQRCCACAHKQITCTVSTATARRGFHANVLVDLYLGRAPLCASCLSTLVGVVSACRGSPTCPRDFPSKFSATSERHRKHAGPAPTTLAVLMVFSHRPSRFVPRYA